MRHTFCKSILRLLLFFWFAQCSFNTNTACAEQYEVTVFAAASTANALTEIVQQYEAAGHGKVILSFGSSSTLAKQIENGAPADIFLSANQEWMEYLEQKKLIMHGSKKNLLGNSIVFIVPIASPISHVDIKPTLDIAALVGEDGRLAVGDPSHVPVGGYAKTALLQLDLWGKVAQRIAPAKDARAGLALVEQGEVPLGIVYASDAALSDKVKVIGVFPANSHPSIDYPVALTHAASAETVHAFYQYLHSADCRNIWKKYGFEVRQ